MRHFSTYRIFLRIHRSVFVRVALMIYIAALFVFLSIPNLGHKTIYSIFYHIEYAMLMNDLELQIMNE